MHISNNRELTIFKKKNRKIFKIYFYYYCTSCMGEYIIILKKNIL